ncbi:transcription factor grauzone-like [Anopheles aquasalis]|uniref:transcription factor grauzone-like n=1 Tax=Anopheles aquasalis TaxID=42839 RepID=UPI00215A0F37|nr:transcription factor grauzone-like [Anopheles aquasalis]
MEQRQCRLCLTILQVFNKTIHDDCFREKLQDVFFFEIVANETLPVHVCEACESVVSAFHSYYKQVEANQKRLHETIRDELTSVEKDTLEPMYDTEFLDCEVRDELLHSPDEGNIVAQKSAANDTMLLTISCQKSLEMLDDGSVLSFKQEVESEQEDESVLDAKQQPDVDEREEAEQEEGEEEIEEEEEEEGNDSEQAVPGHKLRRTHTPTSKEKVRRRRETDRKADQEIKKFYTLECEICSIAQSDFPKLLAHYQSQHGVRGYMRCCNKQFFYRHAILEHIENHRGEIKCEICQKTYKTRRYLALHFAKSHGSEEDRPYKCATCGSSFPKRYLLRAHESLHVQEACPVCKKVLSSNHALKVHISQMHTNDTHHICATCGKTFRTKVSMDRHMKEHLGLPCEEKVQCAQCNKWFHGKHNLKKHVRFKHIEVGQLFRCEICQHESPNSRALSYHKQRVHVEENFACEFCGKRFKRKLYLREHVASHTGNPLYTCNICGVKFNSHANHFTHRKTKHPVEWEAQRRLKSAQEMSKDTVTLDNVV